MRKKLLNQVELHGYLYSHSLEEKVSKKGVTYIGGNIELATDDACLNVVTVEYTYVAPTYPAKGDKPERPNPNFATLQKVMAGKTVVTHGVSEALKLKLTPSLDVNDFMSREGEMIAAKRLQGGFVTIESTLPNEGLPRNRFDADVLISGTTYVEADEERNIPEGYLSIKGNVFNWANALLPVEFRVKAQGGIDYFESLGASASNPVFTKVWGQILSSSVTIRKEEESAFGEPAVREFKRTTREWVITGTNPETYEIGDAENGITADEIKQALSDRQVHLAEVKKNAEEYAATKVQATGAVTAATPAAAGGFQF